MFNAKQNKKKHLGEVVASLQRENYLILKKSERNFKNWDKVLNFLENLNLWLSFLPSLAILSSLTQVSFRHFSVLL